MKTISLLLSCLLITSGVLAQVGVIDPEKAKPKPLTYSLDKETSVEFTSTFSEEQKAGEMIVLKNGKEIQKISVTLFAPPFEMKTLHEGSLGSGSKAFGLTQSYEACGYPSGETVFIWDGKKLIQGPDVFVSNGDGMIVSFNYKIKWLKNCLQVDTILEPDMSVEENKGKKAQTTSEFYGWDGKTLNKSKFCPK